MEINFDPIAARRTNVIRIPLKGWGVRRVGNIARVKIKGNNSQDIPWPLFTNMYEQSLMVPQANMMISTGDPSHPTLWAHGGHLFKATISAIANDITNASSKHKRNFNPKLTSWWDRTKGPSRVAMEVIHRSSIGFVIPRDLLERYHRGGSKSPARLVQSSKRIKHSRYIPQWVRILVIERDGAICRDCGCTDVKSLEFDHLTSFADGGAPDDPDNIGIRCLPCNRSKGRKSEVRS